MKPAVSVIIPALNEAGNIEGTTAAALGAFSAANIERGEVIIIDDGSSDQTGQIADRLGSADSRIRVVHNRPNKGVGHAFGQGVMMATGDYVGLIPGDNEVMEESVRALIAALGSTDLVNAYHATMEVRPPLRRALSRTYTFLINFLFGVRLRYWNGPAFIRTALVRTVPRSAQGFAFMTETLVPLVKAGCTVAEIGMRIRPRAYGTPTPLRPKNVWRVFRTIATLLYRVYCTGTVARIRSLRAAAAAPVSSYGQT